MKKVCWIGPIVPENQVYKSKALSAAANFWQLNFLEALSSMGIDITILSYIPEQTWPFGKVWVTDQRLEDHLNYKIYNASYINIKGVRERWIHSSILGHVKKQYAEDAFDIVFTYNPIYPHRAVAEYLKETRIARNWVSILADDFVKGKPDLTVFLSEKYYKEYNQGVKYHLDGGIQENEISYSEPEVARPYLVYAGSQTAVTGIREFTELYNKIETPPYHLFIYGQGEDQVIKNISIESKYIHLGGFVSGEELNRRCSGASAFVNPRSNSSVANTTFPSKILYYLQFEKPILSDSNAVIDSRYDEFILNFDGRSVSELQNKLEQLKNLDLLKISKKINAFKQNNSWESRVRSLINFIFDQND